MYTILRIIIFYYKLAKKLIPISCYLAAIALVVLSYNNFFVKTSSHILIKKISIVNQQGKPLQKPLNQKQIIAHLENQFGKLTNKNIHGQGKVKLLKSLAQIKEIHTVKIIPSKLDTLKIIIKPREIIASFNHKLAIDKEGVIFNNTNESYLSTPLLKNFPPPVYGKKLNQPPLLQALNLISQLRNYSQTIWVSSVEIASTNLVKAYLSPSKKRNISENIYLKIDTTDIENNIKNCLNYLKYCYHNQRRVDSFNAISNHTIIEQN